MPNHQGNVLTAPCLGDDTMTAERPKPPDDLWEKLDELIQETPLEKQPPPDAFSSVELAQRRGCSERHAGSILLRLLKDERIVYIGRFLNQRKYYCLKGER